MKQSNFILSLTSQLQIYTKCWDRNVLYINSRREREKVRKKKEKVRKKKEKEWIIGWKSSLKHFSVLQVSEMPQCQF